MNKRSKSRRPMACALGLAAAMAFAPGVVTEAHAAGPQTKLRGVSSEKRIQGQYIVVYDEAALEQSVPGSQGRGAYMRSLRAHSDTIARRYGGVATQHYGHAIKGMAVRGLNDNQAARLANEASVAFVEADQSVSLNATQSNATWGLDRIDQLDLPLDSSYTYGVNGSGVNAYIIDTGIRTSHSDFGGRANAGFSSINDGNGSEDCNGHGTHVAGTVGGATWGVAKAVNLYAVRVLDCGGSGSNSGVIAGVDWVTANHQAPAVANMSLGGGASAALDSAVANAVSAGVTMVVAAGNENQNACNVSPSREPSAVTVGSTTSADVRSSFSNYGTCVDIFAPGSSITSTWYSSNSATNTISGTSMASPHVAGAAALYLAEDSSATPDVVTDALVAAAAQGRLSSINSGSPNLLLNVNFDGGTTPPPPPAGDTELLNGDSLGSLSGPTGDWAYFYIDLPAGASNLSVSMSGGSGDADLYLRYGSKPTTSSYDCRPYRSGNSESCAVASTSEGTYWIGIQAYTSYSGVSLSVSYDEPAGGGTPGGPVGGGSLSNLSGSSGSWSHYTISVPAGMSRLDVDMFGGSGDADLYLRYNRQPTTRRYDCRPYENGNEESCSFDNPVAGTWYISIRGYTSYAGVGLDAYYYD